MDDNKRKVELEAEMNRFEQEISSNLPPPPKMPRMVRPPNSQRPPFMIPRPPRFPGMNDGFRPGFMDGPPGFRPDMRDGPPRLPFPGPPPMLPQMMQPPNMEKLLPHPLPPPAMLHPPMMGPPGLLPPGGMGPNGPFGNQIAPPTVPLKNYDIPAEEQIEPVMFNGGHEQGEGSSTGGESKKKKEKKKHVVRVAGGDVWEDSTLLEWDPNDFRIFVGDLGNEVSDDALHRAFSKYPSLLRAKVVRDKKTKKTKGFGFVSFKDPQDYLKAMREMNGKYVGNRPIKLRKSTWKDRNIGMAKKKEKEKKKLGLR